MQHLPATAFCQAAPTIRFDGTGRLAAALRGATLLLGSFDGFHLGHAALVGLGRRVARRAGTPLAILQLDPHPRLLFGATGDILITTGAARDLIIAREGFDLVYAPPFDRAFAAMTPDEFAATILASALGVSAVVTGEDFRFGRNRAGDVGTLTRLGRRHGFVTHVASAIAAEGDRISSSRIRAAIRSGDLHMAKALLGHDWITGVLRGKTGWRIDPDQVLPPPGAWQVEACNMLGVPLHETTLLLDERRGTELLAPAHTTILRWIPPVGHVAAAQSACPASIV